MHILYLFIFSLTILLFTMDGKTDCTEIGNAFNRNVNSTAAVSWIEFFKEIRVVVKMCTDAEITIDMRESCFKNQTLQIFNRIISSNVIPLLEGVQLVRFLNDTEPNYSKLNDIISKTEITWSDYVLSNIFNAFKTHILQIDVKRILAATEARYRHRRNHMLPVMVFGMTALGMVLVPIGFQFLAVLGGKALLLAKMALLLASINGLKRIATSGVHYGLYHVPDPHNYVYDRAEISRPRSEFI